MTRNRRPLLERVFPLGIPLSWLQLTSERKRFAAAVAGITVAVTLMLFLMGLNTALYKQALAPFYKLRADIYILSPQYEYIGIPRSIPLSALWRAQALPEVAGAYPLWVSPLPFKNPENFAARDLFVMAFRPHQPVFADPEIDAQRPRLAAGSTALIDSLSHPAFGRFNELLADAKGGNVRAELNDIAVDITGFFAIGTTFIADGNLITSRDVFLRAYPQPPGRAMLGVVQLTPGANVADAVQKLSALLPADAVALAATDVLSREKAYWSDRTPIGYVITASMLVAMFVGAIIVFQILNTDVSDHLPEYATLKSIGFSDGYFTRLVLQESAILSVFGFIPGVLLAAGLYELTWRMAALPVVLETENLLIVFALALGMCLTAGALATRKLRKADPAAIV
jgi:putative ABC transport system permease protein